VAVLKHNKSKYKKQRVANLFQITPICYSLLGNNSNDDDDDTPTNTGRLSKSTTNHVRSDKKKNHKKNSVKSKVHKVLTLRRLMSYIYGAPILDISRSHTTTQHSG